MLRKCYACDMDSICYVVASVPLLQSMRSFSYRATTRLLHPTVVFSYGATKAVLRPAVVFPTGRKQQCYGLR